MSNLGGKKSDGDKADLYAQWKANSYTIRYEAGEEQGSMEPTQAPVQPTAAPQEQPERTAAPESESSETAASQTKSDKPLPLLIAAGAAASAGVLALAWTLIRKHK